MKIIEVFFRFISFLWNLHIFRLFLIVAVVGLLLLDFYGIDFFPSPLDKKNQLDPRVIGPLSAWFSSLITLVAVSIASESLRANKLKNEKDDLEKEAARIAEEKLRLAEREDKLLREIGSVFCWISEERDEITNATKHVLIVFCNNTSLPVYDWNVETYGFGIVADGRSYGAVPPGTSRIYLTGDNPLSNSHLWQLPATSICFTTPSGEKLKRGYDGKLLSLFDEL